MKSSLIVLVSVAVTLLANARAELTVASLSTITTDIAKNVGGDDIKLIALVKPGVDPHEFQPTPGDVKKIAGADLVLITGKHIEGYLTKLEEATGGAAKFVDTGANVKALALPEEELDHDHEGEKKEEEAHHHEGNEDPHWWHSIANVKSATETVRDAFVKADPANKATYEKNADAYLASLTELQKWAKAKVAELPRSQRKLVTSHDAFQYLAHDYGFTVHPVEGISTDEEPSSQKVAKLIGLIKKEGVKSVFAENIENPKVLTEITKETGAKLGGALYADGLGDTEAKTYPDMVRYNLTTIVEGLK